MKFILATSLFLMALTSASDKISVYPNQKVTITGGSKHEHSFNYKSLEDSRDHHDGNSFLRVDPGWYGKVFFESSQKTYEVDQISSNQIPLEDGVFTLITSQNQTDGLSFSILRSKPVLSLEEQVVIQTPDPIIVIEETVLQEEDSIPTEVVFFLTFTTVLLVFFVLAVLHYNSFVLFRKTVPYAIPARGILPLAEMFFPTIINEKNLEKHLRGHEEKDKNHLVAAELNEVPLDLHSHTGSDYIEQEDSEHHDQQHTTPGDRLSDFKLDDDIMQAINKNKF